MTAKQQLIDDKLVNLAQRCFKSSLVAHFLIRLYIRGCMEAYFVKGFACDTTPCFKIKNSFLKSPVRKNPKEKSFHRRRPALLHND